jgi:hypothetical protein
MSAVILHLSDIHIKSAQDTILKRGVDIAKCLYSSLPTASHIFIVVSGDIAYSGQGEQYALATALFNTIRDAIKAERAVPVSFILVPGNHDCDFTRDNGARNLLIKSLEDSDHPEVDESILDACTAIQQPFFDFRELLEENKKAVDDRLWRSSQFTVGGKIISFECLNVAWVSKREEDPGRLYFPFERYSEKHNLHADIRLVVLHHPINWFNQSIYRPFRTFVRQLAHIVISGHEHQGNVGITQESESATSAFVEGCVLQSGNDLSGSSFNIISLDLQSAQFSSTRYAWKGARYEASEQGSWSDYYDLPAKRTNIFAISEAFQETLDDVGAYFKHPSKQNITLSDIYIYPDLKKLEGESDQQKSFISSENLLSPGSTAEGVLIEGEELVGCTSLLYQLYLQYHARGFIPVFIRGKDIKRTNSTEIDTQIRRAVEMQYGKDKIAAFDQTPNTQKLLLLDDFDDGPMKAGEARAGFLQALRKKFGHLVVTTSEMFEMRELLDGDATRQLMGLEHFQLQPLNYSLRSNLIKRWFSLGADGSINEAALIGQCDQAERLMDAVMAKSIIPSLPLYLLTLLQSIEAGRSGDFKESALGYYYQYLLTEAFQDSGVKPAKLTEAFQYATHMAWAFNLQRKRELTELELREFNSNFSTQWVTIDFKSQLDMLIKARVLCRVGESYAFRYPYIYYYLKGQYLSENLADVDNREYIEHCCKHLYVRDNANTVLFLAHHTNDEFVLNSIANTLRGMFRDKSPITFNGDTAGIAKFIKDAPKLTYTGESPQDHRARRNELRDQHDDGHDGLADVEEEAEELSLLAQMLTLLKTTEILGQVLTNQYAKIQRNRKQELIEDLFNGPLRAIRDFYDFFENNPDAMAAELEAALERKGHIGSEDNRKKFARRVVANLVQFISYALIVRAAQGARSDSLLEDVRQAVARNGTAAFKLIELCILLDSPKDIPREHLKQLYKDTRSDMMAAWLLKVMVFNRLYMFRTTEKDMQWLSSELELSIQNQHVMTYINKQTRRLNG